MLPCALQLAKIGKAVERGANPNYQLAQENKLLLLK